LAGPWSNALLSPDGVVPSDLDRLRADARMIHRQLSPLFHHKVAGERIWSLDFEFASGMTPYDVLTSGPDPYDVLHGYLPDDPRIASVLARLTPVERAVAVAYADPMMPTWTTAAAAAAEIVPGAFAGVDLAALGERVRRKLRRLGKQLTERGQAAAATCERRQQ
jgi:hypothetical protein